MKYVVNIIAELDQKHHSHIGAVYSRVCNMLLMVHKEHINSQDTETFCKSHTLQPQPWNDKNCISRIKKYTIICNSRKHTKNCEAKTCLMIQDLYSWLLLTFKKSCSFWNMIVQSVTFCWWYSIDTIILGVLRKQISRGLNLGVLFGGFPIPVIFSAN